MSKSTYFTGQPVYSQVIKLLDKAKIQQISLETLGSERYVKRLTGWKHLIIMLFGVLKHFDSLRELEIGMKAETMKLSHLGLDYVVRRSTLAEANQRRAQEFFAKVYASLLERYTPFLADSRSVSCQKAWEKQLYMMDSTTITLFDNILKGVGRHPKSGKKKGGIPRKHCGLTLSDKQREALNAGSTLYLKNMVDKEGKSINAYVRMDMEENRPRFYKWNPDKKQDKGKVEAVAEENKTQVAVNNHGKTNEATKELKEPLKSQQTQPTEAQQAKQEQKAKRGRKM